MHPFAFAKPVVLSVVTDSPQGGGEKASQRHAGNASTTDLPQQLFEREQVLWSLRKGSTTGSLHKRLFAHFPVLKQPGMLL